MDISRNTVTGEIAKGSLGSFFRTGDWIDCIDRATGEIKPEEQPLIDAWKLQEAKDKKLAELKEIRNTSDQAPLRGIQAYEVVLDETFNKTKTNNLVFFLFDTQPIDTPVRNPLAILARVYRKGHDNPDYYLPYKCDIEENNSTRKGIIALTYDIAQTIENHMEARGSTNSVFKSYYETVINNCSTIEEVEAVNFGLNDNSSRLIV